MNMTKIERAKVKAKALRDYRRKDPLKVIAIRYGISTSTVSLWAAQAKLKRRPQGCRHKTEPNARDILIVEAVRAIVNGKPTLEQIGKLFVTRNGAMSRANVHRIYHTWKDWVPTVPFSVGDKVRLKGTDYEVIEPHPFDGLVKNLKTGETLTIGWKLDDAITVKLNVERTEPAPAEPVAA